MDRKHGLSNGEILILVLGLIITGVLSLWYYHVLINAEQEQVERIKQDYAMRVELLLNDTFNKTKVLAAMVKLTNGNINREQFDKVSQSIFVPGKGIRALQLLPQGVTTYCYPLKGNEKALGDNVLKMPVRRHDAERAIQTKSIVLSGPYELTQGGLGVVVRNPIFLQDAQGEDRFWGFAVIVLDLPGAIISAGLDNIRDFGYDFQLYSANDNKEKVVISGDKDLTKQWAYKMPIQVPHHQWILELNPNQAHKQIQQTGLIFILGLLITGTLFFGYRMLVLQQATKAKDTFLANMSHDIRTPLNGIIGMTYLAQEEQDLPKIKGYLGKIDMSSKFLLGLINDVLDMTKAESGKIEFHLEPYTIEEFNNYLDAVIKPLCREKNQQLVLRYENTTIAVPLADKLHCNQILFNLLSNAVKYTPEGGTITYTIRNKQLAGNRMSVEHTIADTGIGMSKAFQKKLFEPFSQEGRNDVSNTRGSGLGLAIVKRLVDAMGGTITVQSEMGKGSVFTFKMEFDTVPVTEGQQAAPQLSQTAPGNSLQGKHVLVCEDHPINQELAKMLLEKKGIQVKIAEDGQKGVALFQASVPYFYDAILMDIRMPILDGYQTTKAIRVLKREDARTIPIIAMTANAFDEDIKKCLEAGMNAHLAKPIDPVTLYATLGKYIQA